MRILFPNFYSTVWQVRQDTLIVLCYQMKHIFFFSVHKYFSYFTFFFPFFFLNVLFCFTKFPLDIIVVLREGTYNSILIIPHLNWLISCINLFKQVCNRTCFKWLTYYIVNSLSLLKNIFIFYFFSTSIKVVNYFFIFI